jgi:TRAP-type uncharacterized transport system fused permease subunit
MFDPSEKLTGTSYTTTAALVAAAFIFSPAMLLISHPFGYLTLSLAIAFSGLCIALAWISWKRSSRLSIPSIASQDVKPK